MKVILASNSPRRKELLGEIVKQFDIVPSIIEETSTASLPKDMAKEIACRKAIDVYHRAEGDRVVIGADTVVDNDGVLYGKPKDESEAKAMLFALSGKTHFVHTGVCIVSAKDVFVFVVSTKVTFKVLTESEIDSYVATGSPMDKAGAYGVQDCGFVTEVQGSYNNVVGFPTEKITEVLSGILTQGEMR